MKTEITYACGHKGIMWILDDNWQDRADHVAGPCGQQHCWLELEDDL
ncbi:hypothetical protein [Megasphaera elsdenii]